MRRVSLVIRMFAALSLAIMLLGSGLVSARAQEDPQATPSAIEDATPPVEEEPTPAGPLQGALTVSVFTCANGPEGVAGEVYLEGEFTPDGTCTEDGTASLSIDGGAEESVTSGAQYLLDEGDHTVTEVTLGESATVAIAEATPATVFVVFYSTVEESGEPVATGTVFIMKHVCPEEIKTQEDFDAIGDFLAKAQACPVITLPGDAGPDGSVNGNDPDNQLSFDFEVSFDDGGNPVALAIDTATFVPEQVCESDLGFDINGDPNDNLCLDTSHYAYEAVNQGLVTVTEITPPDGYVFGALEFTPESGDETTLILVTAEESKIDLDTTGDDSVVLHVYNFVKPAVNRVSIIKHQCSETITTVDEFDAIGGFYDKAQECPVVLRGDDDGPDGALGGSHRTFDFEVEGFDAGLQTIDNATFVPDQICEDELGQDINGDPNDNLCLDNSRYQFDDVLQGSGVLVTEIKSPKGYQFGALEFAPDSGDDAALLEASDDGVIELDTTEDGDVVLHIFNIKTPEPEPIPTPEQQYGAVEITKLFCIGDDTETVINILAPGEDPTDGDLGDDTCEPGSADFVITAFGTDELEPFTTDGDGLAYISDLWVTGESTGPHVITEIYSDVSAEFDVEPDTLTRIIVLNYEQEETDDSDDEETLDSGEDLAQTGAGPGNGPLPGGAMLMLGALSVLALAGVSRPRRRSA